MKPQIETYTLKLTQEQCKSIIPEGNYCYTLGADGRFQTCSFWHSDLTRPGQENGYCAYLKRGDWDNNGLGLLWDQCKECGVNEYQQDYLEEF